MSNPKSIGVKINDKFLNQILNTPEIIRVIQRYAKSEYEYSKHDHPDEETYAHLDVVFTFMFSEVKPLVDEHIKLNPGEWYFVDYLQCFGYLLSKYHEKVMIAETFINLIKEKHDEESSEYDASDFDTTD